MKRKITKAQLEEENKWLWSKDIGLDERTHSYTLKQYNYKGELISHIVAVMAPKKHRVPVPKHLKIKRKK